MPTFENVGDLLRAAREKLRLSQEEFAEALEVKISRLQKWESGANQPRFTIAELRRLRNLNREVFDALISGFLLQAPPFPRSVLRTDAFPWQDGAVAPGAGGQPATSGKPGSRPGRSQPSRAKR